VVINTRGGACESGVRYGVQIVNSRVVSGGEGANVQGRVAPNGAVRVAVQAGGQWANGSGHLSMTRGGGVWRGHGSAGYCQGTWVAQRTGYGAKAQAEVPGRPIYNYAPRYYARRYYVPRRYYAPRYYQPAPPPGQSEVIFSGGLLGRPFPGAPQREVLRCSATKVRAAAVAAAMRD
jgi:hypothetical protein